MIFCLLEEVVKVICTYGLQRAKTTAKKTVYEQLDKEKNQKMYVKKVFFGLGDFSRCQKTD